VDFPHIVNTTQERAHHNDLLKQLIAKRKQFNLILSFDILIAYTQALI